MQYSIQSIADFKSGNFHSPNCLLSTVNESKGSSLPMRNQRRRSTVQ